MAIRTARAIALDLSAPSSSKEKVELGLNSHHQALLLSYMKFARYLRGQSIKTVEHALSDAKTALFDDTFTKDEVQGILDNLEKLLSLDMETEMCSFAHNNVLMLQQLFTQAESWHLRMEIQLSELQNKDLLEMIQQLEGDETLVKPAKEKKETEENSIALLRMEIERLRIENKRFEDQQQKCADKMERSEEELSAVTKKLQKAAAQLQEYRNMAVGPNKADPHVDNKMAEMEQKLKEVQEVLQMDQESSRQRQSALASELNSTREKVNQVQAQLQLAELELERKFSETKAYANMKQILMKKNGQIKRLRDRLQEFVPDEHSGGEDGEEES